MKSSDSQERFTAVCHRLRNPLLLRGDVSDPSWHQAIPLELVDAITGQPGRYTTTARTLYDDRYLYVSFVCEDRYVWGTHSQRDAAIYDEECVEIFLNPCGCGHQYFEINVSPKNVLFDACILNQRTERNPHAPFAGLHGWDLQDFKSAVAIQGVPDIPDGATAWSAEYAIPFKELYGAVNLPPKPGDLWRINFFRIDALKPGAPELYAWRPPLADTFHLPWRFGWLRFAD